MSAGFRVLRAVVTGLLMAVIACGFLSSRAAARLVGAQKFLTKEIDRRSA